jgi:plasmid stabilization system protein ParE
LDNHKTLSNPNCFIQRATLTFKLHYSVPKKEGIEMPRGDKSKYTEKQKRQAEHIEEGYEQRGASEGESERRAWATVNKMTGGGKKGGSGVGKAENKEPARRGGERGGASAAKRPASARSASAKKAAKTRAEHRAPRSH